MAPRRIIAAIMLAIALWGTVHAAGAIYQGVGFWQIRKALVIYACVGLFLGFWGLLLGTRRRNLRAKANRVSPPES